MYILRRVTSNYSNMYETFQAFWLLNKGDIHVEKISIENLRFLLLVVVIQQFCLFIYRIYQ